MQYDFSMNASGAQVIAALGSYVKYKSGLGAIRVKFSTGGYVDLTPGQGVRLDKSFNTLNVEDRSGAGNQGVLVIGAIDFQDDTIVGSVYVIDNSVASTLASKCFLGALDGAIATGGNYAAHYLTNPTASGKNVIVESLSASSTAAAGSLAIHAITAGVPGGGAVSAVNKHVYSGGGVPSIAQMWKAEETAATYVLLGPALRRQRLPANDVREIRFAEPIIIRPGVTLAVVFGTTITTTTVNFEFREEVA